MPKSTKHWDGLGHPILDFYSMRDLYEPCERSTRVLSRCLPCQYAVSPEIEISFDCTDPREVTVRVWYPGASQRNVYILGERALSGLRKVYSGKTRGWKTEKKGNHITFKRDSFLYPLKHPKFGILA